MDLSYKDSGSLNLCKACSDAIGYTWEYGMDCEETFASLTKKDFCSTLYCRRHYQALKNHSSSKTRVLLILYVDNMLTIDEDLDLLQATQY